MNFLKKTSNTTPGTRHQRNLNKSILSKFNNIKKNLLLHIPATAGRNKTGRITVRHKGGGCKKKTHLLNTLQKFNGIVIKVMYDSKRKSFISLNFDFNTKTFFKTIAIKNLFPGSLIRSNKKMNIFRLGYRTYLKNFSTGHIINTVSKGNKIIFAKSAGSFCQIIETKNSKTRLRLPSGEITSINSNELASIGKIGNMYNRLTVIGKAGRNRLKGIRPSTRGIAMNPVDHPHGGRSNKGMPPVTPWGLPTKNQPTKKRKK